MPSEGSWSQVYHDLLYVQVHMDFFIYFLSNSDGKVFNTVLDVQEICQGELCRTAL